MKLSVSNIAWEQNELDDHLKLLQELGCDGVEIAPSCIWPEPVDIVDQDIEDFKKMVERYQLTIPSFHALLFTRPDLYLFGEAAARDQFIEYLKKLIRLAGQLSVGVLVYGSPKSRKVGDQSYDHCYATAVVAFRELAREAQANNTCLCIEPLSGEESDFIQNSQEGYNLVQDVNEPGFGLHLDAKALIEAKEDVQSVFQQYGKDLKHFHVSDPGLAPPGFSGVDHSVIGNALNASDYDGFVSIEMRRGFGKSKEVVAKAVEYTRQNYFQKLVEK